MGLQKKCWMKEYIFALETKTFGRIFSLLHFSSSHERSWMSERCPLRCPESLAHFMWAVFTRKLTVLTAIWAINIGFSFISLMFINKRQNPLGLFGNHRENSPTLEQYFRSQFLWWNSNLHGKSASHFKSLLSKVFLNWVKLSMVTPKPFIS